MNTNKHEWAKRCLFVCIRVLRRLFSTALAIYTGRTVSRTIAVALVLVFASDAVCPALFANPESTLPACCRRHGKHHCMMRMSDTIDSGVLLKAVQERCP